MTTKKFESTRGLDEIFVYAYKLRKAGIDPTIVETLTKAILVGAPTITFELSNEELSEDQKNLIILLNNNGFEVTQHKTTIIVKDIHFNKLRDEVDKYLESVGN